MNKYQPIINFFILSLILFIGFWSINYFRKDIHLQLVSSGLLCVGYVFWGIMNHLSQKNLYIKVVIEYLVFALIVFAILFVLIIRR